MANSSPNPTGKTIYGVTPDVVRTGAAAIIFNEQGQILLQKRGDNGLWGLPGGGHELNESLSQTVLREVREETGLDVAIVRLIGIYSDPANTTVQYPDGTRIQFVSALFECQIVSGTIKLCDESLALEFHDPRQLPEPFVPNHRYRVADALANQAEAFYK